MKKILVLTLVLTVLIFLPTKAYAIETAHRASSAWSQRGVDEAAGFAPFDMTLTAPITRAAIVQLAENWLQYTMGTPAMGL
ncbi:MAG: hypothetical protein FWB91_14290, partial [Defluviitaleaceae bacterium]|nr:hypothetical protein [Defluviitaleaceae bacterium]